MKFREATLEDLHDILKLLVDDELGQTRENDTDPLPAEYTEAFMSIEKQQGNQVIVVTENEEIAGCLQLTFIPTIARNGMTRAQIEGVRVRHSHRNRGIGKALFEEAIRLSKENGCGLIQLTTDKNRAEAHGFYKKLGFKITHEGMKLFL